jgi:hypothetical protein
MTQTVEQSLHVTPQGLATLTITLDGDAAALLAGGGGLVGRLRLHNATGASAAELGADSRLTLGSATASGDVRLRDTAGVVRLELHGQGSQMRMRNAQGVEIGRASARRRGRSSAHSAHTPTWISAATASTATSTSTKTPAGAASCSMPRTSG